MNRFILLDVAMLLLILTCIIIGNAWLTLFAMIIGVIAYVWIGVTMFNKGNFTESEKKVIKWFNDLLSQK